MKAASVDVLYSVFFLHAWLADDMHGVHLHKELNTNTDFRQMIRMKCQNIRNVPLRLLYQNCFNGNIGNRITNLSTASPPRPVT